MVGEKDREGAGVGRNDRAYRGVVGVVVVVVVDSGEEGIE